jgi:hypothetical protein
MYMVSHPACHLDLRARHKTSDPVIDTLLGDLQTVSYLLNAFSLIQP